MACVFSFLLISVRTNFSLSSPCTTTSMEKQTNPNRKTNKPKREKKKRDRSVLKKKKNPNGKTNKPKRKNKKRDRSVLVIGAMDRCSCGSELRIGAAVDRCL